MDHGRTSTAQHTTAREHTHDARARGTARTHSRTSWYYSTCSPRPCGILATLHDVSHGRRMILAVSDAITTHEHTASQNWGRGTSDSTRQRARPARGLRGGPLPSRLAVSHRCSRAESAAFTHSVRRSMRRSGSQLIVHFEVRTSKKQNEKVKRRRSEVSATSLSGWAGES